MAGVAFLLLLFAITIECVLTQTTGRVCEHQTLRLTCSRGQVLRIHDAVYGRNSPSFCPGPNSGRTTNCAASRSLAVVRDRCDGETSCSVPASNGVFGDPCVGTFKYLEVEYSCVRSSATCTAWGDPHYTTFDGQTFDFQGDCEYTMVEECVNPTFKLTADNVKLRANARVSYARQVKLEYNGTSYEIRVHRDVLVDGLLRTLPYQDSNGVNMFYNHPYVTLVTDFGLTVRYNGNYHLRVEVTDQLYGRVCGLCGTYNDDRSDDYTTRNGTLADSPTEFGNSWDTGRDPSCLPDPGPIETCEEGSQTLQYAKELCDGLVESAAFPGCLNSLSSREYFQTCVYDLCATLPDEDMLCSSYNQYALACQDAGGDPGNWRDIVTQCAILCPEGSTYTSCGSACPATCLNRDGEDNCPAVCVETCACNEGLVLDGTRCVHPSECGCQLPDASYISAGETILKSDCSLLYSCANGDLNTDSYGCDENAECSVRDGVLDCYCVQGYVGDGQSCAKVITSATCTAWGDPHYTTFDGQTFDFQGDCEYTMVEECVNSTFRLTADNVKLNNNARVSYARQAELEYSGTSYEIRVHRDVLVDGVLRTLPYHGPNGVNIYYNHPYVTLVTEFGLTVRYDGNYDLRVEVTGQLYGKVCGLCGTYNDDRSDDYTTRDGTLANSPTEFGNSWDTGEDANCLPDPGPIETCEEGSDTLQYAQELCDGLVESAAFPGCLDYLDSAPYFDTCVYDLCATLPNEDLLCSSYHQYAQACRDAGGDPGDWRDNVDQCAIECPEGSRYTSCGSACPTTCVEPEAEENCQLACVETCECSEGLVLDGTTCVPPTRCGCQLPDGNYISVGETILSSDCSLLYHCSGGELDTEPYSCDENAECSARDGVLDCHCVQGYFGDGQSCTKVITSATCTAWGDPHYTTFDGQTFDFQGDCEYTMVEECVNSTFELTADNVKLSNNARVSYARQVKLEYNGTTYEIRVHRNVLVAGVLRTLPYQDSSGVNIYYNHPYVTLVTEFGLTVRYDGNYDLRIEVTGQLYDRVCGLCGTFNDDRSDDYTKRNGVLADSPTDFGNSWDTGEDPNCQSDPGPIETCEEGSPTLQYAEELCQELVEPSGAFSGCHDFLPPGEYFRTCTYDLCATLPDEDLLCSSYHQYAQACQNAGGDPGNWRDIVTQCAIQCPESSSYTSCGSACPATCVDRDAENNCQSACVETCECDEGLVLDGTTCVHPSECGCQLPDGSYISAGETVLSSDCSLVYSCIDGVLRTDPWGCDENARCHVRDDELCCQCNEGYVGDGLTCRRECEIQGCPPKHFLNYETCECECRPRSCRGRRFLNPETCRCECYPLECAEGFFFNPRTCKCQCRKRRCPQGFAFDRRCCECKCKKYKRCRSPQYFSKITCQCEEPDLLGLPQNK